MTPLVAHASTPGAGIGVAARAQRTGDALRLWYRLTGPLDRVIVPEPGSSQPADRLWEHTCVEAFIGPVGMPAYLELNVAPSGAWAVYAFTAYRVAGPSPDVIPRIAVERRPGVIDLAVTMPLAPALQSTSLRVGLSAVVELTTGVCTYWALRHPTGRPDFHHPDAFSLVL